MGRFQRKTQTVDAVQLKAPAVVNQIKADGRSEVVAEAGNWLVIDGSFQYVLPHDEFVRQFERLRETDLRVSEMPWGGIAIQCGT